MSLYLRPKTVEEAVHLLSEQGGTVLSGGTDFFPTLNDRPVRGTVVDISGIGEMRGIAIGPDEIRIGGLTTWAEIIRSQLPRCFDALKSAAREIGGVQIQNRGTVAGNLCNASPAADGVPPLLILDADVELVSSRGRRRMRLEKFIVGNRKTRRDPDELLGWVIVPRDVDDAASTFLKLGARRYLVISIAMVAALVKVGVNGRVDDARIAVGSCSAVAQRLIELERALLGAPAKGLGTLVRPEHLAQLSPIDDVRATSEYRSDAALTLISRALDACVGSA